MSKKTLVIGASEKKERYSAQAIELLKSKNHSVVAIGNRTGSVHDLAFGESQEPFENVDTITLYINPTRQPAYYDYIIGLNPKRVIFNPGTENAAFVQKLKEAGIETEIACTLVMLQTGQY